MQYNSIDTIELINQYLKSLDKTKRQDMEVLHKRICQLMPECKLWFLDGKDAHGKVISNPNIGYGCHTVQYANGKTKEFYQIGISANTVGISIYIMGIKDKTYLSATYGKTIGKAQVTGYCIKFKALKDIEIKVLESAILKVVK